MSACLGSVPLRLASMIRWQAVIVGMSSRSFAASSTVQAAEINGSSGFQDPTTTPGYSAQTAFISALSANSTFFNNITKSPVSPYGFLISINFQTIFPRIAHILNVIATVR
jgi:hypothetical protein